MSVGLSLDEFLPGASTSELKLKGGSDFLKLSRNKSRILVTTCVILDEDSTGILMTILTN